MYLGKKMYISFQFYSSKVYLLPVQFVDTIHFISQSLLKTIKYDLIGYRIVSRLLNIALKAIHYVAPSTFPFLPLLTFLSTLFSIYTCLLDFSLIFFALPI